MDALWQCHPSAADAWWFYRTWTQSATGWSVVFEYTDQTDRHKADMNASTLAYLWNGVVQIYNWNENWSSWKLCEERQKRSP